MKRADQPAPAPARVAVVGATGFVGRNMCATFTEAGWEVHALARNPVAGLPAHRFRSLDVTAADPAEMAALLVAERIDVVVNAAGAMGDEEAMTYSHVRLVEQLSKAMRCAPHAPRLVHVGSIHEYGSVPEGTLVDEQAPTRPDSLYARMKLAASKIVLDAARAGEVPGVVLRSVNMSGPYATTASFLGLLVQRLRRREPGSAVEISIAEAHRDYVDVRDLAAAAVQAAQRPLVEHVFNIGRSTAIGMRELIELLMEAAELPPGALRERGEPVASHGGGWTCADIRRAEALLGWSPRIPLRESLRSTWEFSA